MGPVATGVGNVVTVGVVTGAAWGAAVGGADGATGGTVAVGTVDTGCPAGGALAGAGVDGLSTTIDVEAGAPIVVLVDATVVTVATAAAGATAGEEAESGFASHAVPPPSIAPTPRSNSRWGVPSVDRMGLVTFGSSGVHGPGRSVSARQIG